MLSSIRDLSNRFEAEKALRESEETLRLAVRTGKVGLWDKNLVTDQVYYSTEWKRQLGYEKDDIRDEVDEWLNRLHPDDRELAQKKQEAYLKAKISEYENEFRLLHKDGTYRWILTQANIIRDDKGKPVRMLGTHIDITEIKKTYQELRDFS